MVTSLRSKRAAGKALRAGLAVEGASRTILRSDMVFSRRYKNGAGRNRRATPPPAHFQRNPQGRGRLAVFPRCSLGPYESRYGRFARALKNSQPTYGDITIICETVH